MEPTRLDDEDDDLNRPTDVIGQRAPREWADTGVHHHADGSVDRIPPFDKRTGEHYWVVITTYHVDPAAFTDATRTPMLDRENLVLITGVGCFHCETPYTPQMARRRCRGHG